MIYKFEDMLPVDRKIAVAIGTFSNVDGEYRVLPKHQHLIGKRLTDTYYEFRICDVKNDIPFLLKLIGVKATDEKIFALESALLSKEFKPLPYERDCSWLQTEYNFAMCIGFSYIVIPRTLDTIRVSIDGTIIPESSSIVTIDSYSGIKVPEYLACGKECIEMNGMYFLSIKHLDLARCFLDVPHAGDETAKFTVPVLYLSRRLDIDYLMTFLQIEELPQGLLGSALYNLINSEEITGCYAREILDHNADVVANKERVGMRFSLKSFWVIIEKKRGHDYITVGVTPKNGYQWSW